MTGLLATLAASEAFLASSMLSEVRQLHVGKLLEKQDLAITAMERM